MHGTIYLAHDRLTDRIYVGQTVATLAQRKGNHHHEANRGRNAPFLRAIREHGIVNFEFVPLGNAASKEALNHLEKLWILLLDATNPSIGYNVRRGTRRGPVKPLTESHKAAISRGGKGKRRPGNSARITALNKSRIGVKLTAEHRAKCSASLKGQKLPPRTPEFCMKMHLAKIGRPQTEESNRKRSETLKGRNTRLEHHAR